MDGVIDIFSREVRRPANFLSVIMREYKYALCKGWETFLAGKGTLKVEVKYFKQSKAWFMEQSMIREANYDSWSMVCEAKYPWSKEASVKQCNTHEIKQDSQGKAGSKYWNQLDKAIRTTPLPGWFNQTLNILF